MVRPRSGSSTLGCLFVLLLLSDDEHVFNFGIGRFASHNNDQVILRHLRAQADSLGLPEAAGEVTLQRSARHIEIESEYYEHIELPLFVREVRFNPHAEGIF